MNEANALERKRLEQERDWSWEAVKIADYRNKKILRVNKNKPEKIKQLMLKGKSKILKSKNLQRRNNY